MTKIICLEHFHWLHCFWGFPLKTALWFWCYTNPTKNSTNDKEPIWDIFDLYNFNNIDPQANCTTRLMYAVLYMRRSSNIGGWTQIRWSFVVIPLCPVWCLQYGFGLGALEYLFLPSKIPGPNSNDCWMKTKRTQG